MKSKVEKTNSPKNTNKKSGLVAWFIGNHVAANILMMLFIIGGIVSVKNMRTETFPTIDPRLITISTSYPGSTPYEISDSITRRVEESLIGIEGVKRISSTALENYGITYVELLDFADADDVYNEVETAVNSLINFPPQNAEKPIIKKAKTTPNVMSLALHGDVNENSLKYWAEQIEDEIRQISGVASTNLRGVKNYQISVEISESSLRRYNLSLSDISNAINAFSKDTPAGTIESKQGDVILRIQEKSYTGKDFESIVVKTDINGSVLKLGDIAKVVDGFEDTNLISKFNNQRAAFIDIKRSASSDSLKIANKIHDYLQTVKLPNGLTLSLQEDDTVNLKDRMSLMLRNGIAGFVLVFLFLLLFLDLRLAFWTSAAIPISFLGGLMIIHFFGYSLNMISLFALIVVLGIVVDDGIVTGESIFETQERNPNDKNAVHEGVSKILSPVTIGVLTTMAAFTPLIFSTGTLGQIIGIIPVVVISILFVSLVEAYFILPAHLSVPKKWSRGALSDIRDFVAKKLELFIEKILTPAISFSLKWRYATLAGFFAIIIVTSGLVTSGKIRFIFFPNVESDQVIIDIKLPLGTPFETTTKTLNAAEKIVLDAKNQLNKNNSIESFESISVSIGESSGKSGGPKAASLETGSNIGQIKIKLVPSDFRKFSAFELENLLRPKMESLPAIETLGFQSSLFGEEADIEIELNHPDEHKLFEATELLKSQIQKINGTKEVDDTFEVGKNEYVFKLNKKGLAAGITPEILGNQLRAAYFGLEATRFQRGRSEVVVYVRYPKTQREDLDMLNNTRIRLANGNEISLSSVVEITKQQGYSQINTVNGRRIVSVTADVDTNVTVPNDVIEILQNKILPDLKERFHSLNYSFEGESRDQKEDMASLGQNMLIALLIIYILLGSQLRSYLQPFIIMSAIPFGVVGAILGHFVLGYDLTFISMFGIVALTGVIVNDSVVLIDYLNNIKDHSASLKEAVIKSVQRRFRPIILTTLSTSFGLLPILLETSVQAKFLIPMVVSLSMGILFATFIILFLIPCLILISEDVQKKFS